MDVQRPYDCLLNCLKEVHLDRFHPSFVRLGVTNCSQLCFLSTEQYSAFGVMSPEDRKNLFSIIEIIKSLQAGGVKCQHGFAASQVQNPAVSHNKGTSNKTQDNRDLRNHFIKPINLTKNFKVTFERSADEDLKQKQPRLSQKNHSDSPEFQCKKTLNFSDSDLYSDDDQKSVRQIQPRIIDPKIGEQVKDVAAVKSVQNFAAPFSGAKSAREGDGTVKYSNGNCNVKGAVNTEQKAVATAFASTLVFNSKPSNAQHLKGITKEVVTLPGQPAFRNKNRLDEEENSYFHLTKQAKQNALQNSSNLLRNLPNKQHAYFPSELTNVTSRPVHIEHALHGIGYNYGVPNDETKSRNCSPDIKINDSTALRNLYPDRIKVCVRKRPRNGNELKRSEKDIVRVHRPQTVVVQELKVAVDLTKFIYQHTMKFDDVFDDKCGNQEVYERAVKPLIDSLFQRGSAICFAFGQTGAGKTYTLMGNRTVPGLYQLAAKDLFEIANSGRYREPLRLWVSFYEIYCGNVYDLLNRRNRLHIRENGKQKVCVAGLMENPVQDVDNLTQVITYGNSFRSRGSTGVNPHSSRSHAILEIQVRDFRENRVGRLKFIDLAGSERASDATNLDRQTRIEGAEINQSLLALKECIRSIDQESVHTPYRQSKLTLILRDSFLGNAQTVMIANVSPSQSACENTLNTLRYADRVQELRKEVAMRMQRKQSPMVDSKSASQNKSPASKQGPSFFHPSDIPFSSTPMKNNPGSAAAPSINLSEIATESPLSGHKLVTRKSSSDGKEMPTSTSISPIEEVLMMCPDGSHDENQSSFNNSCDGLDSRPADIVLPCSCGSETENSGSRVKGRGDQPIVDQTEIRLSPKPMSSEVSDLLQFGLNGVNGHCDTAQLAFLEAKLCMGNARDNIRDFLDNERRSRVSVKTNVESDPRIKLVRGSGDVEFRNRCHRGDGEPASAESIDVASRQSSCDVPNSVDSVADFRNSLAGLAKSSANCNSSHVKESSDMKSWAAILQESSGSGRPVDPILGFTRESSSGVLVANGDFTGADEDVKSRLSAGDSREIIADFEERDSMSFVASKEIRLLKMKIEELRLQRKLLDQQQLDFGFRDDLFCDNNDPSRGQTLPRTLSKSDQDKATRGFSENFSNKNEVKRQHFGVRNAAREQQFLDQNGNLGGVLPRQDGCGEKRSNICTVGSSDNFNCNCVSCDSRSDLICNGKESGDLDENSDPKNGDDHLFSLHQTVHRKIVNVASNDTLHKALRIGSSSEPSGARSPQEIHCELEEKSTVPSTLQRLTSSVIGKNFCDIPGNERTNFGSDNNPSKPTDVDFAEFSSRSNSAFSKVVPVFNNISQGIILKRQSGDKNPKPATVEISKPALRRLDNLTGNGFEPIEAFPVTPRSDETEILPNGEMTKKETEVLSLGQTEAETLQQIDGLDRTKNLLVAAHEDQLTAVTQLCKREMLLLMAIRTGQMNYSQYMQNVRDILSKKSKIVLALIDHIKEFHTSLER